MWTYCIQHQHIMSEYSFIKCEYSNIIGNTVVSRTYCEHPLLGAPNLLCEATWSFPKNGILYTNEPPMRSHLHQKATLTVSQGWRDHFSILDQSRYNGTILLYYGYTWHLNIHICYYIMWDNSNIIEGCIAYYNAYIRPAIVWKYGIVISE